MIICICKGINEAKIKESYESGNETFEQIKRNTGACTQCGKCSKTVKNMIQIFNEDIINEAG